MGIYEETNGLIQNNHQSIDASIKVIGDATTIVGDSYQNKNALQCVVPNESIIEIDFPKGGLSGIYDIKFEFETVESFFDATLDVYKDDTKVVWNTGSHTNGELCFYTPTPTLRLSFEPSSSYKFVLKSGGTISESNPLIIDYIRLMPLPDDSDPFDLYGKWEKNIRGTNSYTGGSTLTLPVPLDVKINYLDAAHVTVFGYEPTDVIPKLVMGSTQATITFRKASGNLPVFDYCVSIIGVIELPYIKNNNVSLYL